MSDVLPLRFQCRENCGKCCTGETGFVFLSEKDITKLEAHLGQNRRSFVERAAFTDTRHGDRELNYLAKGTSTMSCVFLNGTKCGVYEARPTQCKTFPFWPENFDTTVWEKLKTDCPGIGEGDHILDSTIVKTLIEQLRSDRLIKDEGQKK